MGNSITITMPFKLPPIYTERVLALATPPFHKNYKIDELIVHHHISLIGRKLSMST